MTRTHSQVMSYRLVTKGHVHLTMVLVDDMGHGDTLGKFGLTFWNGAVV